MPGEARPWFGSARRLRRRGADCDGLTVDFDGVTLGRDVPLVRRAPGGYQALTSEEIAPLLHGNANPDRLARHLESIAKALNARDLAIARILGLYFPIEELTPGRRGRLSSASTLLKQNFNPAEPRDAHGRWTSGGSASGGRPHAHPTHAPASPEVAVGGQRAHAPGAFYPTMEDAVRAVRPAAINRSRATGKEAYGGIYESNGAFTCTGPFDTSGAFGGRVDMLTPGFVATYHTHSDSAFLSDDRDKPFMRANPKPIYILTVPPDRNEPPENGGIYRYTPDDMEHPYTIP